MALKDKAQHLSDRLKAAPKAVETALDALLTKVDAMEKDATGAIASATAVVDDVESSMRAVKDVVNQLTNGDPSGN